MLATEIAYAATGDRLGPCRIRASQHDKCAASRRPRRWCSPVARDSRQPHLPVAPPGGMRPRSPICA
eukprot:4323956-Pleurochrysis_carterae.AAC.2